jgi:hypothetical protein
MTAIEKELIAELLPLLSGLPDDWLASVTCVREVVVDDESISYSLRPGCTDDDALRSLLRCALRHTG